MDKLDKMKAEYESITAPDEVRAGVAKMLAAQRRKRKIIRGFSSFAASFVLIFVLTINISATSAYAMSEIPILGSIIRVLTFGKYEKHESGYSIDVTTPKIEGMLDKETEQKINQKFKENANEIIAAMEQSIKEAKEEFGTDEVHMGVTSDFEVKTDNDKILAIDVYIVNTAGSSSTVHDFYTIDKKTGKLLQFKELFKKDKDYIALINDYINKEIDRRNKEEDGTYWQDEEAAFQTITENQKFYIDNDGRIVICFDKYEIAAGAQGSSEFPLPQELQSEITK